MTANAADFRHQSGAYDLVLIIGDSLLEDAFAWKVSDQVQLTFHEESLPDKENKRSYVPRKEIIYQFREDEKRPAAIVSLVFSALTVLPLLILLISVT